MTWFGEHVAWRSGAWSLSLRDDELADVSYDGRAVLRSIRAVVRDRDWNTASLVVDEVSAADSTLTLTVRSEGLGSSFRGAVRVEARDSRLRVDLELESGAEFWTNRTGLVVLHPPQVAGAPLEVVHSDGTAERTAFPHEISPHQPVRDIAVLRWRHAGLDVTATFEGDVFEMEDQRNWTDASFKTYSRPLSLPFPYRVDAGRRIGQTVTVSAAIAGPPVVQESPDRIVLRPTGALFPSIGTGAATAPEPAPSCRPVGAGLLVELDLGTANWRSALDRAARSGQPLDVRFVVAPDRFADLQPAVAALTGLPIERTAVFDASGEAAHVSSAAAVAALRGALAAADLDVPVIGGARSHFTELNREHDRLPPDLDGIAVAVTPLFHALGTDQLVESVAMQRLVALQTVDIAGGMPVHVGPVTLRPRFNNVATGVHTSPSRTDLSRGYGAEHTGSVDERQTAPELASWTVASAAALGIPGVASLTYFEEWGARGIHSASGAPLSTARALSALSALSGGELLVGESPDGLVWAIGAAAAGAATILVANLDRDERTVTVDVPGGGASVVLPAFAWATLPPA